MNKKIFRFIMLSLLSIHGIHSYTQSTQFTNIITALTVSNVSSNSIVLKWKSDKPSGIFSIYYNQKMPIIDKYKLYDSELAVQTNLTGNNFDDFYTYEYTLPVPYAGQYYFAILINNSKQIDDIARGLTDLSPNKIDFRIIPEINTTLQPIYINLTPKRYTSKIKEEVYYLTKEPLITSLNLQSTEDIFRLRWSVYPKDLKKYIFVVYRSRYPITQFTSPEGLPAYATLTNQFFFEDRNISFETPYYYAVIVKDSTQWNRGINVFVNPAVLTKQSPDFTIKPTIEYIKVKRKLPVRSSEILSEEDIQLAVQQTLSNLQILPTYRTNFRATNDAMKAPLTPLTPQALTEEELTNLYLLSNQLNISTIDNALKKEENPPKLSQFNGKYIQLAERFAHAVLANHNQSIKQQENLEKNILKEEYQNYHDIMKNITNIVNNITLYKNLEDKLVDSDYLSSKEFIKRLNNFYTQRDTIRILQYQVKNAINSQVSQRKITEENFLTQIEEIQQAEKKQIQYLIAQYKKHYLHVKKAQYQRYLDLVQELKIARIALTISHKTKSIDPHDVLKTPKLGTVQPDLDDQLNDLMQELQMVKLQAPFVDGNPSDYQYDTKPFDPAHYQLDDNKIPMPKLPHSLSPQQRVAQLRGNYYDVPIEKVPDLDEGPTEKWLTKKEIWLAKNKSLWKQKTKYWDESMRKILGEEYDRINSKWLNPSEYVAINEGQKAMNRNQYKEALYLLNHAPKDAHSLMLLGQAYYEMGYYREAFSVFITALKMDIPESRLWLEMVSEKLLSRQIIE